MAIWLSVLKALPWAAILTNAPAVKRAADGALGRAPRDPGPSPGELQAQADRLAAIEAQHLEMAEIGRQMADQLQRLTSVTEVLAERMRWLTIATMVVAALAVVAIVVAVL